MTMKIEIEKNSKTKKPFYERFSKHLPLFIILKVSFMTAVLIGSGYAFVHAGGGQLTIPEHFKTDVFDPNEPFGQELLRYRYDIFWYWIDRGFYIGLASFAGIVVILSGISMSLKNRLEKEK